MRFSIITLTASLLISASAAQADIIAIAPSTFNESNVFAAGNQRGSTVVGTFDGGTIGFTGTNTNNDILTTFTGGQARFQGDLTGKGNATFDLTSLSFASTSGATFSSVEFRLFGLGQTSDATVSLTDNSGTVFSFTTDVLRALFGSSADRFAFQGVNNQSIARVTITSQDGFDDLRQLRLGTAGAIPEPSTWALLILGFGIIGGAMRRRGIPALA